MEEALSAEGWKHREVVEMIDDGYGGTSNQRMDRMRKAVAGERLWRSMTDGERAAALAGDDAEVGHTSNDTDRGSAASDGAPDTAPKRRRA
jgi:hypothetical protein